MFYLLLLASCEATGSYPLPNTLSLHPDQAELFDDSRYNLGKEILAHRVRLLEIQAADGSQTTQLSILQRYSSKLPTSIARVYNLPSLAGRLSIEQLEAITYYLTTRFQLNQCPEPPAKSPEPEPAPLRLTPGPITIPVPEENSIKPS